MRIEAQRWTLTLAAAAAAAGFALPAPASQAASRSWQDCGRAATKAAADGAGVPAALDADPGLRRIFAEPSASTTFDSVDRAYCADFDGDGDLDRAALYTCCTVSSPSPFVILRNRGTRFTIAYAKLASPVFRVRRAGRALVLREPRYSRSDANCCPSRYRDSALRWTGKRFKSNVRLRRAPRRG